MTELTEGTPTQTQMKSTKKSSIEDWTNEDVINWIEKIYADKPKRKDLLVNSIKENEYTGEELLSCSNYEELMEALEISKKIIAKNLFKQMKQVKENAIAQLVEKAQLGKNNNNLKLNDTKDLDYLIEIYEGLFPVKRENEIKSDEIKQDNEDDSPIQQFVKMVKASADTIKEFVKSLMGFGYTNKLTQKIINICMTYYKLLDGTLNTFTAYGGDIKKLHQCMTEISNIFLLPVQVKNGLDKLDTKSKQNMIIKLREATCGGLKNATARYKKLLEKIDKMHVKQLQKLGDDWTKLYQKIMNLLNVLKEDKQSKQETCKKANYEKVYTTLDKLKSVAKYAGGFCPKWIGTPLTFGMYAVASFAAGAAIGAGVVLCGTGAGAVAGAALIVGGVLATVGLYGTIDKALAGCINKGNKMMNNGSNELDEMKRIEKTEENIKQIELMQDSLKRMANVSYSMSNVIKMELHNFQKIKEHNPDAEIQCGGFNDIDVLLTPNNKILKRIQKLGESILNSTKYLEKSKKNIEIVEVTCQQEMKNFGRYIHKPLLKMLCD
eukprot:UN00297